MSGENGIITLNVEDTAHKSGVYTFTLNGMEINLYDNVENDKYIVKVYDGEAEEGEAAELRVVTTGEVGKVRFTDTDGNTITVAASEKNDDGTKTWSMTKSKPAGEYEYSISVKVGYEWITENSKVKLTFTEKILDSGLIRSAEYDAESGLYKITIEGRATKIQFISEDGMTRTYTRYHDSVKSRKTYDEDGNEVNDTARTLDHEIWLVDAKIYSGQKYTVMGKFEAGWNREGTASQFEKPDGPHAVVNASDGSQWYQMASGSGAGAFYDAPVFSGNSAEAAQVAAAFPDADGATLRTVGDGVIEASSDGSVSRWYNSAYYDEPDAPHSTIQAANGVEWYAMQQHAETPPFEAGDAADGYNRAQFQSFMPGYEQPVTSVDGSSRMDGHFEIRHENGSGTMFYDTSQYSPPRGDYQVYEDVHGSQWYAVHGEAAVERKPVYENGKPVYDGDNVRTVSTETVRYKSTPSRYGEPKSRDDSGIKPPRRRR